MNKLAAVIVNYKNNKQTKSLVLQLQSLLSLKLNNIYIETTTYNNIGYGAALNRGIAKAKKNKFRAIMLLNPDIKFTKLSQPLIFNGLKHFDILGCTMKQNNKCYYGGHIDHLNGAGGLITKKPKKTFFKCDFVSGSCMIIKNWVFNKIGLLDESFFLYYEDVAICTLAAQKKLRIGITTKIHYTHFEISQKNPKKEYYLTRGRLLYILKYGTTAQKIHECAASIKNIKTIFMLKKQKIKALHDAFKIWLKI